MRVLSRLAGGAHRYKEHTPNLRLRGKNSGWSITGDETEVTRYVRDVTVGDRVYEIHFGEDDIDEFMRTLAQDAGGRAQMEYILKTTAVK